MRPSAQILTIGNELLKGNVLNTNARFLGRELTGLGYEVAAQASCRDRIPEIIPCLRQAFAGSDCLVVTGGLGPTPDDVTRDAVAEFMHAPLIVSARQLSFIRGLYRRRRRHMPKSVVREAMFPKNAEPLFNRFGIALGFYLEAGRKIMIVLPGVPEELESMFHALVVPLLKRRLAKVRRLKALVVKTVGISEPALMEKVGEDFFKDLFDFGIYPETGEVTLRLYADRPGLLNRKKARLGRLLAGRIYAFGEADLSRVVGGLLARKRRSLAVAESCTGGLLASELTRVPGASRYFKGSVTAYHRETKAWMGVPQRILAEHGAVSPRTALELARQVRKHLGADFGLGITGVAGPGKEEGKPAGLVYIALVSQGRAQVWKEQFLGERAQIQKRAAKRALEYLWRELRPGR